MSASADTEVFKELAEETFTNEQRYLIPKLPAETTD